MKTAALYVWTAAAWLWIGSSSWLTIGLALAASAGGCYHALRWGEVPPLPRDDDRKPW